MYSTRLGKYHGLYGVGYGCWGSVASSKMAAKMVAIMDFTKNSNLPGKCENCIVFFPRVVQCDIIRHFSAFGSILCFFFFHRKTVKNALVFKNGLTSCYL